MQYQGSIHPPVTDRVTDLRGAPLRVKLRKLLAPLIGALVLFGPLAGLGFWIEWQWLQWGALGIGALLTAAASLAALRARVAPCPFCGHSLGSGAFDSVSMVDDQHVVECGSCFELLVSHQGQVQAMRDDELAVATVHEAPLVAGARWPMECIVCGLPVSFYDELWERYPGLLQVAALVESDGLRVPYCEQHAQQVSVVLRERRARLSFHDHRARRRYCSCNHGKRPIALASL